VTPAEVLGQLPGLREAKPAALQALADQFERTAYKDGELICDEGAPAETLYVLARGAIDVRKRSISGREHTVAELHAPCLFGHVGVLSLTERTASIRAKGPVELLNMSARRARVVMRTGEFKVASPFRRALIVAMCQQLTSATATVASLAVDAGVAEPPRPRLPSIEDDGLQSIDERLAELDEELSEAEQPAETSILPDDAEERLLKGISQV